MEQEKIERWRYPRFFSTNIDTMASIIGEDAKHISNVIRMKEGDIAVICDGNGTDFLSRLISSGKECVFEVLENEKNEAEPNINVRLFMAVPKSDKMEFIVQKATELGITEIIPMITKRCVSRPDKKDFEKKKERYSRIVYEAAKQCGRGKIPVVHNLVSFKEALSLVEKENQGILFYECGGDKLSDIIKPNKNLDIFIGSEGGFEPQEVEIAKEKGLLTATLGKRILRCETAPIAATAILMNITGNME